MNFTVFLTLSVLICLVGLALRFHAWFTQGIHPPSPSIPIGERIQAGFESVKKSLAGNSLVTILKSAGKDLLFQERIFQKSHLRWIAHTLIFFGFIALLLMHAMDGIFSENLFADYYSTLNPYLFLRNFFGLMVLAGVGIAVYRRITLKNKRLKSYLSDWAALILVGGIVLSGILLEGSKISSYTVYQEMVEEYGAFDDEEETALEAYWVAENGLISPNIKARSVTDEQVEAGIEANESSCIECHSANSSAFVSYTTKPFVRPFSWIIGDSATVTLFLGLHLLFCLALLVWLPFGKMFHIVAAPVSLLVNSILGKDNSTPANILNRQMIGLSACTHCGSCSLECSSSMFFESFGNDFILPSEKIQFLKHIAGGKEIDSATKKKLQEGLYVCTSCDRCTDICPSGINLKEIFVSARYALLDTGVPEKTLMSHFSFPLALAQRFTDNHLKALQSVEELFRKSFKKITDLQLPLSLNKPEAHVNESYKSCYSCQRCTNICPVVRSFEEPVAQLDLLPHQLIYSLGIGNREVALGSRMIWSCSTCYLCQEHCPNQVELTDIFYSLKNSALKKIDSE